MLTFILQIKDLFVCGVYLLQYCQLRHLSSLCSHFHSNKENYSMVNEHMVIIIIYVMYTDVLGWRKFQRVNINSC